MSTFKSVTPAQFNDICEKIGKDWFLIAAEKDNKINAMTAGWGGIGFMWGKDAVFAVIRPSRYTKEFIDGSEHFSLCFFDKDRRDMMSYFGKVSGRDEDKIAKSGLTVISDASAPYFAEANAAIVCRKLYAQPMEKKYLTDLSIDERWYPQHDYHTLYIGEIENIFVK